MSPLVKTKRQANLKDFKRFGAFKEFVEQKNVVFNSFVCKLSFFGTRGLFKTLVYVKYTTIFNEFVCKLEFFWDEWADLKRE
jgi:hypothetical protein